MICPDCLVKERVTEGPNVGQPCLKYNELVTGHRKYQNIFRQGSLARAWRRRPCAPAQRRAPRRPPLTTGGGCVVAGLLGAS